MLILDDFHLVDESPDVRQIVRDIVTRAPERLTLAFVSRRAPAIPLARLRAVGEVAEIGTDDLRFDSDETARLFSEAYGRALEPDVLADVAARTEGWAASLQLVHAALRDRSPVEIRRFVRGPERGGPGALRLPCRRGRRRSARRPAAVPDVYVDPPGRHPGPRGGCHRARARRRRPPDGSGRAPDPPVAPVACGSQPAAVPSARPRIPGGAPACDVKRRRGLRPPPSSRQRRRRPRLARRRLPLPRSRRPPIRRDHHRRRDPRNHGKRRLLRRRRLHSSGPNRPEATSFRGGDVAGSHAARRLRRRTRRSSDGSFG